MDTTLEIKVRKTRLELSSRSANVFTRLDAYDWILFTSKNTVQFFTKELRERHITLPKKIHVAAIGDETANALRVEKISVHHIPKRFTGRDLVKSLEHIQGMRILFPRSAIASHDTVRGLRERGARVTVLPLYTTSAILLSQKEKAALLENKYAYLLFKSPSGIYGLLQQLRKVEQTIVKKIPAHCIGPTTAAAAREVGFKSVSIR